MGATLLPVVIKEGFSRTKPTEGKYYTLGGNHLRHAQCQVDATQEVQVKVYQDLTVLEATRIAVRHNQSQHKIHCQTFEDRVTICRKLLYSINSCNPAEEPPATNLEWRHACAIALGKKCSGDPKDIDVKTKSMGPIFQVARYCSRDWAAVNTIITNYRKSAKKHLSQTVFLKLQGLDRSLKTSLLEDCGAGRSSVEEMGNLATEYKRKKIIEYHLMKKFDCSIVDVYEKRVAEDRIMEFVKAKEGKKYRHAFTQKSVSPEFSNFLSSLTKDNEIRKENEDESGKENENADDTEQDDGEVEAEETASEAEETADEAEDTLDEAEESGDEVENTDNDEEEEEWKILKIKDSRVILTRNGHTPETDGAGVIFHEIGKVPTSMYKLKKNKHTLFVAATTNHTERYCQVIEALTEEGEFVGEIGCGGQVAECAVERGRNAYIIAEKNQWPGLEERLCKLDK